MPDIYSHNSFRGELPVLEGGVEPLGDGKSPRVSASSAQAVCGQMSRKAHRAHAMHEGWPRVRLDDELS